MMLHKLDHFINYGCARYGNTDQNDRLHKVIKACYSAKNHNLFEFGKQLLSSTKATPISTVQSNNNDPSQVFEYLESILLIANFLEAEQHPRNGRQMNNQLILVRKMSKKQCTPYLQISKNGKFKMIYKFLYRLHKSPRVYLCVKGLQKFGLMLISIGSEINISKRRTLGKQHL